MSISLSTVIINKLLRNSYFVFRIYLVFSILFLVFIAIPQKASAAFIIQRPLYIGLTNGLVGQWSFDGPDMLSTMALDTLFAFAIMALLTPPVQSFALGGVLF